MSVKLTVMVVSKFVSIRYHSLIACATVASGLTVLSSAQVINHLPDLTMH